VRSLLAKRDYRLGLLDVPVDTPIKLLIDGITAELSGLGFHQLAA
jgi:hypothetical protein